MPEAGKSNSATVGEKMVIYTPAMRQFLQIKEENPGLLLLYRMGDFYETFFEDAHLVHKVLGLTLTSRSNSGNGDPIPMAGIPYTTLDQYLTRLVNQGYSVGICEQIGVPGKGVMERKLTRTITPGTLTDEALLNERGESSLLAIFPGNKNEKVALSWMIISSGQFRAMEIPFTSLLNEVERLNPSEILIPESFKPEAERILPNRTVTALPDWHFDRIRSEKTLLNQFGTATLEPFSIADNDLIITAAGVVSEYAQNTQGTELSHITSIVLESDEQYLGLDAVSRRNLEISQTLRGDQSNTLYAVLDHCKSTMGSRRLLSWITSPTRDLKIANSRSDTVSVLLDAPALLEDSLELLKSVPDFERTATRIALGTVRPRELAALRDILPKFNQLSQICAQIPTDLAETIARKMPLDPSLYALLDASLKEEPSTLVRDGDVIKDGFNAELDELRALKDHSGQFLIELEAREKERTNISTLRVEYNSVHGYFIEVSKAQADKVPPEYRRRQTLKNVERYITPELKEFEDKALSAQERAKALEKDLYEELVKNCQPYCTALLDAAWAVSSFDALCSFATHAQINHWVKPILTEHEGINIKAGRHPVVERSIENFVPNDCELNKQRKLLVITGPNMGGKSTYMRSIALIVLLAYSGSFVPAQSAEIGPIDKILTRIGAADDLARGLSTFMVEMTETATILRQATDRSLVLMDEVGRGTSTFDGLSLAASIAEDLAVYRGSLTLFATHYFELTQLEKTVPSVVNVHVAAAETNRDIVFLHEIREGAANQSYGIAVAKLAGLPRNVIKNAQKILVQLEERAAQTQDQQLDLFANNAQVETESIFEEEENIFDDALVQDLKDLDMDELSPRQAWEKLKELQNKVLSH